MTEHPVILITGASSGIGAATARHFASSGYRVILAARREERLTSLANEICDRGGQALPIRMDVADLDSIETMVDRSLDAYGQIDILFNNAGFARQKWLEDMAPDRDISLQIGVNLLGVIYTTRAVLPHMIQRRSGHIINMSSMAAFISPPTYSVYSATKCAIRGFSEALRREVGVRSIKVSTIYPAVVDTEFITHTEGKFQSNFLYPNAFRLTAEDVAKAIWKVVRSPRKDVILPKLMIFAKWLNVFIPGVIDKAIEVGFVRSERGL